jgi:putative heme-binding domain-containing protein
LFDAAESAARDRKSPEPVRAAAIRLLGLRPFNDVGSELVSLLDQREPQPIQLAAIAALDRFHEPLVAEELLKRWGTFTPRVRSEAMNVLLRRGNRAVPLLNAIESRKVRRAELSSNQVKFLREHQDKPVSELATRVLADTSSPRHQVVDTYASALDLKGDATRGRDVFRERCVSCHRLAGEGSVLGPDLVTVKAAGNEKLLTNIVDPNREVQSNYLAYLVETKSGDSHLGLIASDTPAGVTVRQAYGVEVLVPRGDIKRMRSQDQSLMPEGLEEGLTVQALADLLEFISTADAER